MKKVIASLAALAAVSCAAVTASAASSIEFKLDAAKSNATTKVVDVNLVSDDLRFVLQGGVDILFGDSIDPSAVTFTSQFTGTTFEEFDGQIWTLYAMNSNGNAVNFADGVVKLATLTIPAGDCDITSDYIDIAVNDGMALDMDTCDQGTIAVVDAEDLGVFADGEGAAVKAYKAAAAVDGTITWNVTDGTNVATVGSEVSGGADVIVGLRVAGANVANITYAAVTID